MTTTTIKPGILVALRSTVAGGVSYSKVDLAADRPAENDAKSIAKWETTRIIEDEAEHARAVKVCGLARREIEKHCTRTSFGLLAPAANEADLDAGSEAAKAMIREFNEGARYTRINLAMLKGRVAASDEEAVRAITAEVSGLVADMNRAIDRLDVDSIRQAANKAQSMLTILGEDEQKSVTAAVEAARKAARMIVKRVSKDGEPAAVVLADIQRGAIERARIAFLDLDEDRPVPDESAVLPAVDLARTATLDLSDDGPAIENPAPVAATALDLDEVG